MRMKMETPPAETPVNTIAVTTAETTSQIETAPPIEATPPIETPVERVTNNKNPQKVAVGQKGAAAKKAREEALREQLRRSKEKIQPPPAAEPAPTEAAAPRGPEQSTGISYIVLAGVAAVAVGAVLLSTQRPADAASDVVKERAPKAGAVLNRRPDPFYMS